MVSSPRTKFAGFTVVALALSKSKFHELDAVEPDDLLNDVHGAVTDAVGTSELARGFVQGAIEVHDRVADDEER